MSKKTVKKTVAKKTVKQKTTALKDGVALPITGRVGQVSTFVYRRSPHVVDLRQIIKQKELRHRAEEKLPPASSVGAWETLDQKLMKLESRGATMERESPKRAAINLVQPISEKNRLGEKTQIFLAKVKKQPVKIKNLWVAKVKQPFSEMLSDVNDSWVETFKVWRSRLTKDSTGQSVRRSSFVLKSLQPTIKTVQTMSKPEAKETVARVKHESRAWEWRIFGRSLLPESTEHWVGALVGFLLIAALVVLPIRVMTGYARLQQTKTRVIESAEDSFDYLLAGGEAAFIFDIESAEASFAAARDGFKAAEEELTGVNLLVKALLKGLPKYQAEYQSAESLLKIGSEISMVAEELSRAMKILNQSEAGAITERILASREAFKNALVHLTVASSLTDTVTTDALPENYRQQFVKLRSLLPSFDRTLSLTLSHLEPLAELLGHQSFKRYLVVFQNPTELRPTGGFMGSYALMDVDRGQIVNLEIPGGGPYDLQGSLSVSVAPPQPLQLIQDRWEFQDANWWPDWPTSAEKIIWFYEKSGGPTVDGVIALSADILPELLKITGPIPMTEYEKVIDADNFFQETQRAVEIEYDRATNKPKQFIADLTPRLIERLQTQLPDKSLSLLSLVQHALSQRMIQIYLTDEETQKSILALNWAGELKSANRDFLALIHTNVAGGKTDRMMKDVIDHQATIAPDGTVINTVTITREHRGKKGDLFSGVRNVDFMRLYVPQGSVLLSSDGFKVPPAELFKDVSNSAPDVDLERLSRMVAVDEVTGMQVSEEFDKTVFGNWVQVDPGENVTVSLTYRLPWKVLPSDLEQQNAVYSLYVQKQVGTENQEFLSTLYLPSAWRVAWQYPADLEAGDKAAVYYGKNTKERGWVVKKLLNSDNFFGVTLRASATDALIK